ncbi:MAG TPA: ABC transporter ATP-binding protein, partial [Actinomycetota bacterium]|nr:ABC transporter ATP-binding protein [Actinomycetota bacterium]
DVGKAYEKNHPILSEVDLTLDTHEVVAVKGRNGSGKTTLLRLILGLTIPSQGRVITQIRHRGFLPERVPAPPFRARNYLLHMAAIHGLRRRDAMAIVESYAERLGLTSWVEVGVPKLSKGTRQKVGLIQALLGDPEILVLDEPWTALDQPAHLEMNKIIEASKQRGCCVLVTDHRDGLSTIAPDRILHIEDRRVYEMDESGETKL